jgi:hypothetical protein
MTQPINLAASLLMDTTAAMNGRPIRYIRRGVGMVLISDALIGRGKATVRNEIDQIQTASRQLDFLVRPDSVDFGAGPARPKQSDTIAILDLPPETREESAPPYALVIAGNSFTLQMTADIAADIAAQGFDLLNPTDDPDAPERLADESNESMLKAILWEIFQEQAAAVNPQPIDLQTFTEAAEWGEPVFANTLTQAALQLRGNFYTCLPSIESEPVARATDAYSTRLRIHAQKA